MASGSNEHTGGGSGAAGLAAKGVSSLEEMSAAGKGGGDLWTGTGHLTERCVVGAAQWPSHGSPFQPGAEGNRKAPLYSFLAGSRGGARLDGRAGAQTVPSEIFPAGVAAEAAWNLAAQKLDREDVLVHASIAQGFLWYLAIPAPDILPPDIPPAGLPLYDCPPAGYSRLAGCLPGRPSYRGPGGYRFRQKDADLLLLIEPEKPGLEPGRRIRLYRNTPHSIDQLVAGLDADVPIREMDGNAAGMQDRRDIGVPLYSYRLGQVARAERRRRLFCTAGASLSVMGLLCWLLALLLPVLTGPDNRPSPAASSPSAGAEERSAGNLKAAVAQLNMPGAAAIDRLAELYRIAEAVAANGGTVLKMHQGENGQTGLEATLPAITQPASLKAIHESIKVTPKGDLLAVSITIPPPSEMSRPGAKAATAPGRDAGTGGERSLP